MFPACAVNERARLLNRDVRLDFDFPVPSQPGERCYSAEIRLVVDTAGIPEQNTGELVRSNDAAFGTAVLAGIPHLRFNPARKDGVAVRQVVEERIMRATVLMSVRQGDPRPALPALAPSC